jgi:predicted outer membrane repeat protein
MLRSGGGAITNHGVFKGEDLLFIQNEAAFSGGAVLNRNGTLTLTRVRFEGNHAQVHTHARTYWLLCFSSTDTYVLSTHTYTQTEGSALCIDGPATPTKGPPALTSAAVVQDSVFVGNGLLDMTTTTTNSSSAAIHQQGALMLVNCSFQGSSRSSSSSSGSSSSGSSSSSSSDGLWVGSGSVSTTVAYCSFDVGAGILLEEALTPLLSSLSPPPLRCLGTAALVFAGPDMAAAPSVCRAPSDLQLAHLPPLHMTPAMAGGLVVLIVLVLGLVVVVRRGAANPKRR